MHSFRCWNHLPSTILMVLMLCPLCGLANKYLEGSSKDIRHYIKLYLHFKKIGEAKNISRYTILANQNIWPCGYFFSTWLCIFSRYIGLVIQIDGRELRRNQVENPLPRWRWWINMKLALWTYELIYMFLSIYRYLIRST